MAGIRTLWNQDCSSNHHRRRSPADTTACRDFLNTLRGARATSAWALQLIGDYLGSSHHSADHSAQTMACQTFVICAARGSGPDVSPVALVVQVTRVGATRVRPAAARKRAGGAVPSLAGRFAGGCAAGRRSPGKPDSGDRTAAAAAAEAARIGAHAPARQTGGA